MRSITGIVVHCTATRPEWWADKTSTEKMEECRRWHVDDNGWADIGYHYLIDRDGTITEGRPIEKDGAHVKGHNRGTIGISLWGGHGASKDDAFDDHFTDAQAEALRDLIGGLRRDHGAVPVTGHNEYANKGCPGFNVGQWMLSGGHPSSAPKRERASRVQSKTLQSTVIAGAGAAATGTTAIASLSGTAQVVAIAGLCITVIALAFIFKERLRKWSLGDR